MGLSTDRNKAIEEIMNDCGEEKFPVQKNGFTSKQDLLKVANSFVPFKK